MMRLVLLIFFKLNMNGEGFRARQAFMDRVFVWKQYDEIFSEAIAQESEDDLLDMAFYQAYLLRMSFPKKRGSSLWSIL